MRNDKYDIGTSCIGDGQEAEGRYEVTVYTKIPAADVKEVNFDPNFKAYLTFGLHTGIFPSNIDESLKNKIERLSENDYRLATEYGDKGLKDTIMKANAIYYNQLSPKDENEKREANPFHQKNGERAIVPISSSQNLIDLLTDKMSKGFPAKFKIIRFEDILKKYFGIGIKDLYEEHLKGLGSRPDRLVLKELEAVNRECQFEVAVPEHNKEAIAIVSPDPVFSHYPILKFSENKKNGIEPTNAVKAEEYLIKQEDLKKIGDKVVIPFGHFHGPRHKFNPRRRLLMYMTPEELVPKL